MSILTTISGLRQEEAFRGSKSLDIAIPDSVKMMIGQYMNGEKLSLIVVTCNYALWWIFIGM